MQCPLSSPCIKPGLIAVCLVTVLHLGGDTQSPRLAVTQTVPDVKLDEKLTCIELVPCPDTIVVPAGTVQL